MMNACEMEWKKGPTTVPAMTSDLRIAASISSGDAFSTHDGFGIQ